MLNSINPTQTNAWKKLKKLFEETKHIQMRDQFASEKDRAGRFSVSWNDFYFDYSKNRIDDTILQTLFQLAEECGVYEAIESMFLGEPINTTENRAVLHTALRRPETDKVIVDKINVVPQIQDVLKRMKSFAKKVRNGQWKGYSGKRIKNIVNIGIGGSDLGPQMVAGALKPLQQENLELFLYRMLTLAIFIRY